MKLIIAVLVSTFAFGSAIAQSPDSSASPHASANASPSAMAKSDAKRDDAVEHHITDLHAKLKITPAQEDLWSAVTTVMRANAKTMEPLKQARYYRAPTMTAVEDFTSYAEIADAHADGIKRFVPVFTALYDSMSDAQKKTTDTLFRRGGQK